MKRKENGMGDFPPSPSQPNTNYTKKKKKKKSNFHKLYIRWG